MRTHPQYIKIPDDKGNLTRVLKLHRFRDTPKVFYIEPAFWVVNGEIMRKDGIFEGVEPKEPPYDDKAVTSTKYFV